MKKIIAELMVLISNGVEPNKYQEIKNKIKELLPYEEDVRAFELIKKYRIDPKYIDHNTYEDYYEDMWNTYRPIDSNDEYQFNKQIMCKEEYEFLERMLELWVKN